VISDDRLKTQKKNNERKREGRMRNRFACLLLEEGTDVPVQEGDVAETHNIRKFSSTDKFRSALRKLRKPSIYLRTLANDLLAPEEKKRWYVCV